jgi:hypothetical protein
MMLETNLKLRNLAELTLLDDVFTILRSCLNCQALGGAQLESIADELEGRLYALYNYYLTLSALSLSLIMFI